jgi:AraC-like DNA-binding protein|tara:strand:- start:278 stop:1162 length:885 start_codon:yes stop_codon:yes gene_type:complete
MKNQNIDKSLWDVCELEKDFFVLRAKNESSKILTKKHNTNIDHIQFHFCLKGQLDFMYNNSTYSFNVNEENAILLFNPDKNLPIEVNIFPGSWLISILVPIKKFHSFFSESADHISFLNPDNKAKKFYDSVSFPPSMAVVLSQILNTNIHDSIKVLYFKGKVYELLGLYFNKSENKSIENCPFLLIEENVIKIKLAKDIVLERMANPPTIDDLASEIGLSTSKLKEGFKKIYGNTIYSYLLDYKMEEARRMLESKKSNINEIGHNLGYSTASHFITAFKKKYGTTPKKYLMSVS